MKTWNDLSIREKSAMMRTAIQNGITNLNDIKKKYNEFAEGGPEDGEPVLLTPYLNDTPMQAAMRRLNADWNKSENKTAVYNATHPISPSNGGFVMNSDGSFSKVNPNPAVNTSAEAAATVAEFLPVIGDAMYAGEVYDAAKQGNYGTAAALVGLAALPNALEKPVKKVLKKVGLFDNATTAVKATPAEWTAAQDAAVARGDMAEALRLRELHNEIATKDVPFKTVGYRGIRNDASESPFYFTASGDTGPAVASTYMGKEGTYTPYTKLWSRTKQLESREKRLKFLKENNALSAEQESLLKSAIADDKNAINEAKKAIESFSDPLFRKLYISAENPAIIDAQRSWWNSIPMRDVNNRKYYTTTDALALKSKNKGNDVLVINNVKDSGKVTIHDPSFNPGTDVVVLDSRRAKSAGAVTYDDNGIRIPLGERDNFNIKDVRYIWPLAIMGTTAATTYGANQQSYGGPLVQLAKKYEKGGPEKEEYIATPVSTYIQKPLIPEILQNMNSPEEALKRTYKVYSNYSETKDNPLTKEQEAFRNTLRWFQDRGLNPVGSGVSNCTLTATQWIDPNNPIKNASSIYYSPEQYNYTPIDEKEAVPGNIIIAKTPGKESYHTMLINGFAENDGVYNFNGTPYKYKKGEPLMTYSRGGHDVSFIQRNIPLSVYTANSDGHTENYYYRYNYPYDNILPEIVVTPKQ